MKKFKTMIILTTMSVALCACGKETAGTKDITESVAGMETDSVIITEESSTGESSTENSKADENEGQKSEKQEDVNTSYAELDKILDEINTDIMPGTAGSSLVSVSVAADLLDWGVGTSMSTDEIKNETVNWLSDKSDSDKADFAEKLAMVYDSYHKLLEPDAKELLEESGCGDAAYPWSDTPVETIEAIIEVVQLPEDASAADSTYAGPDVAELVNLKGDKTTVYLLADGRYMDRADNVYTYDGIDTWTDESGVEWNEVVK